MVKLYRFLTRRLDLTHDEAVHYWTERHAPLVVDALGDNLEKYVTNVGLPNQLEEGESREAPPWDGIDEMWLNISAEEVKETFGRAAAELAPSERLFLGNSQWMLVEEVVQRDDRSRPYQFKILEPLLRRRDRTWDEFADYWLNQHVPLVKKTWGDAIVRYMTNLGLSNPFNWRMPEEGPPYDGVAEFYFDWTMDEYKQTLATSASILIPDEILFVTNWRLAFVTEIVQKENT
jgi:uncharacterized protein (TIGR02118 family)